MKLPRCGITVLNVCTLNFFYFVRTTQKRNGLPKGCNEFNKLVYFYAKNAQNVAILRESMCSYSLSLRSEAAACPQVSIERSSVYGLKDWKKFWLSNLAGGNSVSYDKVVEILLEKTIPEVRHILNELVLEYEELFYNREMACMPLSEISRKSCSVLA